MSITVINDTDQGKLRGRRAYKDKILRSNGTSTRAVQSEYGEKMLKMMGWTGEGLGKNQDGIQNPIQAVRRDGNFGIGAEKHDESWNDDWWMDTYLGAMKSVKSKLNKDGVFVAPPSSGSSRRSSGVITRSQLASIVNSRKASAINMESEVVKTKSNKAKKEKKDKLVKQKEKKAVLEKKVELVDSGSEYSDDDEQTFKTVTKKILKKKKN